MAMLLKGLIGRTHLFVQVVALLTQVTVDPTDEAFQKPTKFIGPSFSKEAAEK